MLIRAYKVHLKRLSKYPNLGIICPTKYLYSMYFILPFDNKSVFYNYLWKKEK